MFHPLHKQNDQLLFHCSIDMLRCFDSNNTPKPQSFDKPALFENTGEGFPEMWGFFGWLKCEDPRGCHPRHPTRKGPFRNKNFIFQQGCRFGPESSRQTLELPIFTSRLVPSVAANFRKCIREQICNLRVKSVMNRSPRSSSKATLHELDNKRPWVFQIVYIYSDGLKVRMTLGQPP